ncbi:MAG: proton-conducting transporter membrane subunit [Syntrophomonas sp.]
MITGKHLVAVSIWLPAGAALLCYLWRSYRGRNLVVWLSGVALAACSIGLYLTGPFNYQPGEIAGLSWNTIISAADFALLALILLIGLKHRHRLITILALTQAVLLIYFDFVLGGGEFEPGPAFVIDHLAIIMALVINIVGSLICIYGVKYIALHEKKHDAGMSTQRSMSPHFAGRQPRFMFWLVVFLGAMNGLVFANNLYWMYFFWEVTTFCSFQLIGHDLSEEAIGNACRALWVNSLGGTAFILALVGLVKYGGGNCLSVQYLLTNGAGAGTTGMVMLAIALLVLAGMTKSAQLPFQNWLLGAMVAPTPVSALLHSSTMVKAGVYLILRLAPVYAGTYLSDIIAIAGAFTFLISSLLAVSQSNAKRVLAYSTIANLGLIITCAGINTPAAISAAIILIIFHAVSKGVLFLCTGFVEYQIGSRDIEDMEGLADRMPLTTAIFTVSIISMFLPPFGMLVGKWAALEAATGLPLAVFMMVIASAVTALFWIKWLGCMLQGKPGEVKAGVEPMAIHYKTSLLGLAGGAVLLGMFIVPLLKALVIPAVMQYYPSSGLEVAAQNITSGNGGLFTAWPWFALLLVIMVSTGFLYNPKTIKSSSVYLCGENSGASSYTSTGENSIQLVLGRYYFDRFLSEAKWTPVINSLAILIIIILLGVTVL